MSKHKILFLATVLMMGSGLCWILLQGSSADSIEAWHEADIELIEIDLDPEALALDGNDEPVVDRQAISVAPTGSNTDRSDRPRLGIHGRIVDRSGLPLENATVRLEVSDANQIFGGRFNRGRRERVRQPFITMADGRFSFQLHVYRQTRVYIYASREGLAPSITEHRFDASIEDMDTGDTVLTGGGSLTGKITDVAGNGIADAEAFLLPVNSNALRSIPDRAKILTPVRSDAGGYFFFTNLMPGEYRIAAQARHYRRGQERQAILIEEGQQVNIGEITLMPGFAVFGYVYDQHGDPLRAAKIEIRNSPTEDGKRPLPELRAHKRSRSDVDGSFRIDHLPAAPMSLTVRASGHLSEHRNDVDPTLGQAITINLAAGLTISGRITDEISRLAVEHYAIKLHRQGDLSRGDESPAANSPRNRGGDRGRRFGRWQNSNRPTNDLEEPSEHPDGAFRFEGLDEGIYVIDVGASVDHHARRSQPIELRQETRGAVVELSLSKGYAIAGQIIAKATGKPIPGIRVELMRVSGEGTPRTARQRNQGQSNRSRGQRFTRFARAMREMTNSRDRIAYVESDASGKFEFPRQAPNEYFLVASGANYARTRSDDFVLDADQDAITLALGGKATLSGQVDSIPTNNTAEIHVVAFASIRNYKSILAAVDGSYHFAELEPGDYYVRAIHGDSAVNRRQQMMSLFMAEPPPPFDLSLAAGEQAILNLGLEVPKVGEILGTIFVNGSPAQGYGIRLRAGADLGRRGRRRLGNTGNLTTTSNSRGEFQLRDIPAGDYSLRVQRGGRGRSSEIHSQKVAVRMGVSSDVHITLFIGSIRGNVTADDGSPAEDMRGQIILIPGQTAVPKNLRAFARNHSFSRITVSEGKFEATNIKTGPALLILRINGRKEISSLIQIQIGQETAVTVVAGEKAGGN